MTAKVRAHLQYWDAKTNSWWGAAVGKGVELNDPETYAIALGKNGKRTKVTVVETGEIFYSLPGLEMLGLRYCDLCESTHTAPYDGSCLL